MQRVARSQEQRANVGCCAQSTGRDSLCWQKWVFGAQSAVRKQCWGIQIQGGLSLLSSVEKGMEGLCSCTFHGSTAQGRAWEAWPPAPSHIWVLLILLRLKRKGKTVRMQDISELVVS